LGGTGLNCAGSGWYWVSVGRFCFVLGGTGLSWCDTVLFLVVMGQCGSELFGIGYTWSVYGSNGWYLVIFGQYSAVLLVLAGTGSVILTQYSLGSKG